MLFTVPLPPASLGVGLLLASKWVPQIKDRFSSRGAKNPEQTQDGPAQLYVFLSCHLLAWALTPGMCVTAQPSAVRPNQHVLCLFDSNI